MNNNNILYHSGKMFQAATYNNIFELQRNYENSDFCLNRYLILSKI